jgi:hypothetical protein
MVWYFLFIIYSMYCILPIPFKWCVLTCTAAAGAHVLSILFLTAGEYINSQYSSSQQVSTLTLNTLPHSR